MGCLITGRAWITLPTPVDVIKRAYTIPYKSREANKLSFQHYNLSAVRGNIGKDVITTGVDDAKKADDSDSNNIRSNEKKSNPDKDNGYNANADENQDEEENVNDNGMEENTGAEENTYREVNDR